MDEARWLDEREDRAWRGYRRMRALLDLRLARDLDRESGLSEADYDVLSTLSETDGDRLRLTELAARLLWSTSRLSHHVTRMQNRGLVARQECPDDARGSTVALTRDGRRAIEDAAPGHVASVRRNMIDLLTPAELTALDALSHRVVAHLTAADPGPTGDRRP
ncbi:MarR family transcriptional regulator [Solwaraspora sp. WMMD1047]|uniref:MarR family winged helix-turn-helix transcriptional regulator n=1 Tax=Solwaraspora sp. WMMD1047 TaxID=3016102 RepID=UPI002415D572|nr:MarR family transcriptional regulator [Solwaraspora sp. WMMD1047]MDG4830918.1 MarR family transcriptional regulator [Solwaraspora sp. WMMD1047]